MTLSEHRHFVSHLNKHTCLINLEAFIHCEDTLKSDRFEYILNQIKNYKNVIASLTWENREPNTWLPWLQKLKTHVSCVEIFDCVYEDCLQNLPDAKFIDFCLIRDNFELTTLKSAQCNQQWKADTNRFLFLTGKPNKLNRVFLLKKLLDAGLENYCIWSLFIDEESRPAVQQSLSLDDHEFNKFLDLYTGSPDNTKSSPSVSGHYVGYPYDVSMFQNTSFRIISESEFNTSRTFFTEKTWITIANHHPFIMAGNVKTLEKLKSKGFKTFENYLSISNYDEIENPLERIDAIVINTRDWLQTIKKDHRSIRTDILHNRQVYDQLLQKNMMIISDIFDKYGVTLEELYQAGYFSDMIDKKWLLFYNNVKDQSWPNCLSAKYFEQLPLPIKQELIDVFRFNQNDFL